MLKEHLSQDHDLASRRTDFIAEQVEWIHKVICDSQPKNILDLGCGPGFYLKHLAAKGYTGRGIDFSPASIDYARAEIVNGIDLVCEDIRLADFGSNYDLVSMIYGEFNVFAPQEIVAILGKAFDSLRDDGAMIIEPHTFEAVKAIGEAQNTWYKSSSGLFSDKPHICLIENQWIDKIKVAQQCFYVIELGSARADIYRNTTRAWTNDEYKELFINAGFKKVDIEYNWPSNTNDLFLMKAVK
jgi:SAM-dependent methyltransferase